jgi:hypothetical protein
MGLTRKRARGRKESDSFAMLPNAVTQHPAMTTLSPALRWVLVALVAQYKGGNNGALALPLSTAKLFGITSTNTLNRGLRALEDRGFIVQTFPGSYSPPKPARYGITWKPMDATDYSRKGPPTSDFRGWSDAA